MSETISVLISKEDIEKRTAELAKKINEVLWDEKDGCYYDVFADDMSLKSRCMACSMFTPSNRTMPGLLSVHRN